MKKKKTRKISVSNDVRMMLQKKQRERVREKKTWKVGDSRILNGFSECGAHRKLNQNSAIAC